MKETIYGEYIDLKNKEEVIRNQIKELEEKYIDPIKSQINEIVVAKESARDMILEHMKETNEKTHDYFGTNITRSERSTLKIEDEEAVIKELDKEKIIEEVIKLTGWKRKDYTNNITQVKLTSEAKKVVENLYKTGIVIKGVELNVSEYLTIR